jgi:tryptophan synthase beta subunit
MAEEKAGDALLVVNLSGRGDKDMEQASRLLGARS